jgi:2-polyprenyl-3-methyl-5-hydroxy-6-metoxy-1,4-benzoquinol methylase
MRSVLNRLQSRIRTDGSQPKPMHQARIKRISPDLLTRMSQVVSREDRDEMAIPSYLHSNPVLRWMAWRRLEVIASLFRRTAMQDASGRYSRVMDFGCGTGVLFDELSRHAEEVIGVDIVLEPARLCISESGYTNVTLMIPGSAESEISARSLDVILAAEVLEHIEPLDGTLQLFRDWLRANGKLLVSLPTENALYRLGRRIAGFDGHYHESNAAAIHKKILENGFRTISVKKLPAPGPLAIYWVAEYELA